MTTTITIPSLRTERLLLRAPKIEDFEAYAAFRSDPVRTALLGGPFTRDQAFGQLANIIGQWQLRGFGRWIVADGETDAAMGVVGLYYPLSWPEPEIAWSVFADAEGRGIAFEAAQAARAYAYEELGWTTAISLITEDNSRSAALAKRMGAKPDGAFPIPGEEDVVATIWRHPGPEALRS